MNDINKIDYFFEHYYTADLKNISMFKIDDGYELFNKYMINKVGVYYNISHKNSYTNKTFFSLLNAFAYCIYDHRNKIIKSQQVEIMDAELKSLDFSIARYKHLISKKIPFDNKTVYIAKLNESMLRQNKVKKDLDFYIKESLNWQDSQFNQFKNKYK